MRPLALLYAILVYGFIFLPVAVLVLFSFQGTLFPIPPFNGPSLRWYNAVLADERLTSGLVNSVIVALVSSGLANVQIALPEGADFRNLTPEGLAALPEAARMLVANAYSDAFVPLFLTASGMMVIGLICALLLPNIRLPREGEGKATDPAAVAAE